MKCVQSLEDIKNNISTFDAYLGGECEREHSFAVERVKRGVCFLVLREEGGCRFYPSRFIGYIENTIEKHLDSMEKDGRETNLAISKVLKQQAKHDAALERAYRDYCEKLGFTAREKGNRGIERKYWEL